MAVNLGTIDWSAIRAANQGVGVQPTTTTTSSPKTAKFDWSNPDNHIPISQMTPAEQTAWTNDYIAWSKADNAQRQVRALEQLQGSMQMIEANQPQPAGGDSPFLNYTRGYGEIPSVDAYGGGNTPPHWKALYGAIQSGAAKIKSVPDGEGGSYLALVDKNGNPTRGEVTELAPGVYKVYSGSGQYSQQFVVGTDPKSGYVSPITDYSKQSNSWRHSYAGGGISGVIQDIAQGLMDLGPLGKVAMAYAVAQTGGALASTLGISTAAGTALANAGLQVAQGKDITDALEAAAIGYAGGVAGQTVGGAVADLVKDTGLSLDTSKALASTAGSVASGATKSALTGTDFDPLMALQTAGVSAATPLLTGQIEGFDQLPAAAQRAINASIAAELSNKDPTQALINAALQSGANAVKAAAKEYEGRAMDDGTTAGIQDIIDATKDTAVADYGGLDEALDVATSASDDAMRAGGEGSGTYYDNEGRLIVPAGDNLADEMTTEDILDVLQDGAAVDDGTTEGIQDIIDQLPVDDGTTDGIQDIIDQLPVDDGTTEGVQEVIDQTPSIPAVSPSSPATTPPPASKPSSVSTPSAPKIPTTPTPSGGLDLASLLALLGSSGTPAPAEPPPTVDIGEQLDISAPLELNPFARKQTQSKMAAGGSIDDLLALLQQRG